MIRAYLWTTLIESEAFITKQNKKNIVVILRGRNKNCGTGGVVLLKYINRFKIQKYY